MTERLLVSRTLLPITGGDLSLVKRVRFAETVETVTEIGLRIAERRSFTSFKRGVNENCLINTQLQLGGYNHAMLAMDAKKQTLRAWRALREEFNSLIVGPVIGYRISAMQAFQPTATAQILAERKTLC